MALRRRRGLDGRRFRFGVIKGVTTGCEEAVRANFERSLETLRGHRHRRGGGAAGPAVGGDHADHPARARRPARSRTSSRAAGSPGSTAPEDHYSAYARDAILAKDYVKALRLRGVMAREADRVLARFDALVGPGRATVAPAARPGVQERHPRQRAATSWAPSATAPACPRVCVPNGFGDRGLPTSLQFMGRACEENTILAAARAWQSLTDWHLQHPPGD